MILVDTSVWVDHLRAGDPELSGLLNTGHVLMHPFVLGELACGNLQNRREILLLLRDLPVAATVTDDEALFFIERHTLMGRGIGYVDVHLLSSTAMSGSTQLWTRDRRLHAAADSLGLSFRDR